MTDRTILIFAGRTDRHADPAAPDRRANQIRLGGVYGAPNDRWAIAVDMPDDLLSAAARRLVTAMDGNMVGGPIRLGLPRLMVRRRRIGIDHAAALLGYAPTAALPWMEMYRDSVADAVVREDLGDCDYPTASGTAELARQLNRLASRPGLVVQMPGHLGGAEIVIDPKADAIDETIQAHRWAHLLRRGARSAAAMAAA